MAVEGTYLTKWRFCRHAYMVLLLPCRYPENSSSNPDPRMHQKYKVTRPRNLPNERNFWTLSWNPYLTFTQLPIECSGDVHARACQAFLASRSWLQKDRLNALWEYKYNRKVMKLLAPLKNLILLRVSEKHVQSSEWLDHNNFISINI